MRYVYILPVVMIFLDVVAALVYIGDGNLRMSLYWLSAAVLTTCVTFNF
jgi:hypothetical protein